MSFPKNIRAVVTGAAGGLGWAVAEALASQGARLLVADIDEQGAVSAAKKLSDAGAEAYATACDVRDPTQVEALASAAESYWGGSDLIVNNAGVAVAGPIGRVSLEDWRWVMDVNLWGVIHGCHTFVPRFEAQGHGYVLNVASAAGLVAAPLMGPYSVTKFGVVALSETLYAEVADKGISVTVLCPTFFKTNIMASGKGPGGAAAAAEKRMSESKIQAPEVARFALDALAKNQLYALPMVDGRVLWRLKRLVPSRFPSILNWISRRTVPNVSHE